MIGRSIAFLVAVALLGAAATPSVGDQMPAAVDEVPRGIATQAPPGDEPVTVLVLGDSVTREIAPPLLEALASAREIEGHDRTFMGFGLSRIPLGLDWPGMATELVAEVEPDVVVIQTGLWDFDTEALGAPFADPRPGDPDWQSKYADVMTRAVDILTAGGADVYWLTMLPMDWTERTHTMNATVTALGELDERVKVIDLVGDFVDSEGLVIKSIPGVDGSEIPIRKVDDIHLCRYGAKMAAETVAERLLEDFGLPLEPGWENGTWRDSPVYEEDPCPGVD